MTGERVERCVCGGVIRGGDWRKSRPLVEAHNRSLRHMHWRLLVGIVTPGLDGAPPDDPQRHWPTADDEPVDVFQGDAGASAIGAEGAA